MMFYWNAWKAANDRADRAEQYLNECKHNHGSYVIGCVACYRELEAERDRAEAAGQALAEALWTSWFDSRYCRECKRLEELGHLSWCKTGAALTTWQNRNQLEENR